MQEHFSCGFQIKEEKLIDLPEYHEFLEVLKKEAMTLEDVALMSLGRYTGIESEIKAIEALDRLRIAFKAKYPGFSISPVYIPEGVKGDVSKTFWCLENAIKPDVFEMSDVVTWSIS